MGSNCFLIMTGVNRVMISFKREPEKLEKYNQEGIKVEPAYDGMILNHS